MKVLTMLTPRQLEILQLRAEGLTLEEIAGQLWLTHDTVRSHADSALKRLGARNAPHAVALALRSGLIE